MFDQYGYPTDETLDKIRTWDARNPNSLNSLFAFIEECWSYPEYWETSNRGFRREYTVSTGGWSGNEDLIEALKENMVAWAFSWDQSRRGGHYIFLGGPANEVVS